MKYLLMLFVLVSSNCYAENYLTLTLASKHFNDKEDLNETNPGIGLNLNGYLVGQYKNSHSKNSVYAGYQFEKNINRNFSYGSKLGLVTGYTDSQLETPGIGKAKLFAIPQASYKTKFVNYMLGVIPAKKGAVTFQVDVKF